MRTKIDDAKEWMSASKLKLNPDKTEFIVLGSKRQRDKLKVYFPTTILCGFPCPNMFRMSAKVVLFNSMTLDMSGSFLLMMFLYLWPMLLLVVGWIIVTHFSGISLSSIWEITVSNTSRYTSA